MASGGKRKGSGSKAKYNEPTTTIAFRVPVSKVDELKDMVNAKLSEWSVLKFHLTLSAYEIWGIDVDSLSTVIN